MGTKVFLNLYDLSPANDYLYPIGFGLHHSGVEILGSEYSFASGAGVFDQSPREVPNARYRETFELGVFDGGQAEFKVALSEVKQKFLPDEYDLIRKNCNHFANALVWRLLGRQIPSHVNRLADVGVCCSCLIPKKTLSGAPVGDPNNPGNSEGSSGFQSFGPRSTRASSNTPAFTGSGARLGTITPQSSITSRLMGNSNRSASPRAEDLTDRRERARKAAMARLDKKPEQQD